MSYTREELCEMPEKELKLILKKTKKERQKENLIEQIIYAQNLELGLSKEIDKVFFDWVVNRYLPNTNLPFLINETEIILSMKLIKKAMQDFCKLQIIGLLKIQNLQKVIKNSEMPFTKKTVWIDGNAYHCYFLSKTS